jgi:hypothetical protein
MKTFAIIIILMNGAGVVWSAETGGENKPVISRTAPRLEKDELENVPGKLGPGEKGGETAPIAGTERVSTSTETISQDIQASAQDEVPIVLDPPPMDLPFKDVVGFARPGQGERVLTGPVDHMPGNEILGLAVVDARQGLSPLALKIPTPPFVRMEAPFGNEATQWTFRVEDPTERAVYQNGGISQPPAILIWDGYTDGVMQMRAGVVYQPVLRLTDPRGLPQQFFGDPMQLDVMQFDQAGVRHVEFRTHALFQNNSQELAVEAVPLVRSLLNAMRVNDSAPYRVTLYESDSGRPLAEKRLSVLKKFLMDALVMDSDRFVFEVKPPHERGPVVEFLMDLVGQANP